MSIAQLSGMQSAICDSHGKSLCDLQKVSLPLNL